MTATAPITQDVLTIPRKAPEGVKPNLIGLTREQLRAALIEQGTPEKQAKMREGQIWQWLYHWGVRDFAVMTNLSKDYRAMLAEKFAIRLPEIVTQQVSADGTRKYLLRIDGGHEVETVYIPEEGRGTLCISSQVGCTLTCSFCHTGTQKLVRNLTAAEIVGQVMIARDDLNEWNIPGETRREDRLISNVVLMGMGEPLANYDNLLAALRIVNAQWGFGFGARRVTISTSGVVPKILKLAEEPLGFRLAISLHGATNEVRNQIMPVNKKFPLEELIPAAKAFARKHGRMLTLEFILIEDINDSLEQAKKLAVIARELHAHVNLIPYNKVEGLPWVRPSLTRQDRFVKELRALGVTATLRREKGHDIDAACGQLRLQTEKAEAGGATPPPAAA